MSEPIRDEIERLKAKKDRMEVKSGQLMGDVYALSRRIEALELIAEGKTVESVKQALEDARARSRAIREAYDAMEHARSEVSLLSDQLDLLLELRGEQEREQARKEKTP